MRISDWSSDVCSSDLLEVHDVADHVELVGDPVAAMHVAGLAGDVEGLAAGVALAERDRLGRRLAGVQQAAELQAGLQADGHLGLHVGAQIGRASCRVRGCQYVSIPAVAVALKNKINSN